MMQVSHQQLLPMGGMLLSPLAEQSPPKPRRLFIGDIPKTIKAEVVKASLCKIFPAATKVEVYSEMAHGNRNRGFAFLEYDRAEDAAEVRLQICSNPPQIHGRKISCDWAQLEPEVPEDIMKQVKVLFVRNVHHEVTEEQLHEIFGGVSAGVEKVKRQKMHAFVHFNSRRQAATKKDELNGIQLNGLLLEIAWSKPKPRAHPYMAQPVVPPPNPFVHTLLPLFPEVPAPLPLVRQPDLIVPTVITQDLLTSRSSTITHFQILLELCKKTLVPMPVFLTEIFYRGDPQGVLTSLNKVVAVFDNGVRVEGETRSDLSRSMESTLISTVTFMKTVRELLNSQPPKMLGFT